jgi:hypothetical protein
MRDAFEISGMIDRRMLLAISAAVAAPAARKQGRPRRAYNRD